MGFSEAPLSYNSQIRGISKFPPRKVYEIKRILQTKLKFLSHIPHTDNRKGASIKNFTVLTDFFLPHITQ